jgi:3-hydroxyacyl-[acyl-carrier-protein] dehydratase
MLSGNFYDIQSFTDDNPGGSPRNVTVMALLNEQHPIFKGHFPGNPVVPGVCQIQMVKELVEKVVNHPLHLTASDNIKFLAMINPLQTPQIEFRMAIKPVSDQRFSATVSIVSGQSVLFKFKGEFVSGQ